MKIKKYKIIVTIFSILFLTVMFGNVKAETFTLNNYISVGAKRFFNNKEKFYNAAKETIQVYQMYDNVGNEVFCLEPGKTARPGFKYDVLSGNDAKSKLGELLGVNEKRGRIY